MANLLPSGIDSTSGQTINLGLNDSCLIQSGKITSPGTGADTEQFGQSAVALGDSCTAIGNSALAGDNINNGDGLVAIGFDAQALGAYGSVAIGINPRASYPRPNSLANQSQQECIAIGDSPSAGGTDCIAIGDGLIAGAPDSDNVNFYADLIAIGDGCDVGDVNNQASQVAAVGDGITTSFSGNLTGTPIYRVCVLWSYVIGGVTYFARTGPTTSASTGTFGPFLTTPANLNGNTGAFVLTFTTPPDNGTDITAQPNFGSRDIVAIGDGCSAKGSDCIAIGNGPTAGSDFDHINCISIGDGAFTEGAHNIAIGEAVADGGNSIAIGTVVTASTATSLAIGASITTTRANQMATSYFEITLGGTTASFPMIKRSAAELQARLANDSAFADFQAAGLQANGRILGFQGADVASAADITLTSGNFFNITGTTQVDTISATGWTPGSQVVLQFPSGTTIANNTAGGGASILLAGGANFTAAAGDLLSLIYNGTNWVETSRTVL